MSEDPKGQPDDAEDAKSGREKVEDGIRQGIGVLSAFKDALEETIHEARERGDLSADRAKTVMKDALQRAQTAAEGARDRIEFSNPAEVEALRHAVDSIRVRVGELEESVFGESKDVSSAQSKEDTQEGGSESSSPS